MGNFEPQTRYWTMPMSVKGAENIAAGCRSGGGC
jgi:hypothetical protein